MKYIKLFRILTIILASFTFFALETKAYTELSSDDPIPSIWTKSNSPYVIKTRIVANDPVTIEPGVVVKFKYAASAIFNNSVTAIGTEKEKIVFTAWADDAHGGDTNGDLDSTKPKAGYWYRLLIGSSAAAHFENTLFLYGGEHPWGTLSLQPNSAKSVMVKNSEFRHNKYAGIYINYNPDQIIEKNTFSDNGEGIVLNDCYYNASLTISNNSFDGNINYGAKVNYPYYKYNKIYAQNNWWGDWTGPYHPTLNPNGKGDQISDNVIFDPWIGKEKPDPVIVIPGIMGSWEKNGIWQIDPIFHTYDDLRSAFLANGYEIGENYFEFPYQWRDSNIKSAKLLQKEIQKIKEDTSRPKVDIVAHSMGGLLAREYIESDYYQNDVDQLITLGTPHLGAPKSYIKWEAGAFFSDIFELAGKHFFNQEAKENGYDSIFHYIRGRSIESVRELLPVYDYLWDDNGIDYDLRVGYPTDYPRNEFLENLNKVEKMKALEDIEFVKIVGKPEGAKTTISGYNVVNVDMGELWEHGYPHSFEIPWIGDQGLRRSEGDRTVPLLSAESNNILSDKIKYLSSNHNSLPTDAQQDILEILTGRRPDEMIDKWQIDDIFLGFVFSPVDVQIISPSNKRLGKDFATGSELNEIAGAYYAGFNTNTEFFVIPNPEDGEYKILTQGTGEGEYKIETTKITDDSDDPDNTKESSVIIEGETQVDEVQEAKIEVAGDEIIYNPDKTPPMIDIFSPEEKSYNNDGILTIDYTIEDTESGVENENWQVEKDGQNLNWLEKNIDLSLERLGSYTLKVFAMDKAGNQADEERKFQITTNLNAIQTNLAHYYELKLIKKRIAYKYFNTKLNNLEKLFELLEKIQDSKLKPKPKQTIIEALKRIIDADINRLTRQIDRKSPRWIDPKVADFLIEDINFIRPEN